MTEIEWMDPPKVPDRARGRTGYFTPEIQNALESAPGRWARVARSVSDSLVKGWRKTWPDFEFENRPVSDDDGNYVEQTDGPKRVDIFARFVAPE